MGPIPPVHVIEMSVRTYTYEPHRGEARCDGAGRANGRLTGLLVLAQESDHGPTGAAEQPAREAHIGNAGAVELVVAVIEGVRCGEEAGDLQSGSESFGGDGGLQLRPGLDASGDEGFALNVEDGADAEGQHGLRLADPEFAFHFPAPVTVIWHSRSTLRMELRVSQRPYRCSKVLRRLCCPFPWPR